MAFLLGFAAAFYLIRRERNKNVVGAFEDVVQPKPELDARQQATAIQQEQQTTGGEGARMEPVNEHPSAAEVPGDYHIPRQLTGEFDIVRELE